MTNLISRSIALSFLGLCICVSAYAQNTQRQEEEAIKDQERESKRLQILQQQKIEAEQIMKEADLAGEGDKKLLVEVEPINILPSDLANVYTLVPYKIRRNRWGHTFTVGYNQYNPTYYQSDYLGAGVPLADGRDSNYENAYGSEGMFEVAYSYKWNFIFGSIGGELGAGLFSNDADVDDLGDATLSIQIARAGLRFTADNLFLEPRLAPYGYVGVYTALYEETQGGASFDGNTAPALYWGGGLLMQLNWLDKISAVEAYAESGIENTFLFAEVRQYMASSNADDPDLSTDMDLNFGMTLEF